MSDESSLSPVQVASIKANAEAIAQVLMMIVPQAFSSGEITDQGRGQIDEWKMAKIPSRALPSYVYLEHRGEYDEVRFYKDFVDKMLRGSHSIDGFGLNLMKDISIGMTGGGGKKNLVKRPGLIGRYITNRNWEKKAQRTQSQVVE